MELARNVLSQVLHESGKKTNFIFIAGCSCCGKTTLANNLVSEIKSLNKQAIVVQEDSYFKNIKDVKRNYKGYFCLDDFEAFHLDEMKQDLKNLINSGKMDYPKYDICSNTRVGRRILIKKEIIIVEGLHVLEVFKNFEGFKIYMDTSPTLCLERRTERDMKLLNVSKNQVQDLFVSEIYPSFKQCIEPQKRLAELIVENNEKLILTKGRQANENERIL
ncbi:MAG: AAA family ATPase [Clostridia bacterium]